MSVQSSITGEQISTLDEEVESTYEAKALPSSQEVAPSTYLIKPPLSQKFRAQPVQLIIKTILRDMLTGVEYSQEGAKELTKKIANEIRDKVRELNFRRYKIIVQVHIGEQKGAGVKSGIRCLWDSECDNYTSDVFMNDTLFCMAVVYAVYFY
ncbi:dynein light chain Tctex-type protein 2B-like isoform X1 [Chrysoperla carnea]|uniref:dynein light chain Tctex-type protein 2B-like isoform X1 n=1 Tax=Chrysoperla carnea TaxID=189513 RepID=UPI001D0862DA|nr:dynein light chain Tctex-type protein 2B-like isoform X1 [Chrysoperla carnea]